MPIKCLLISKNVLLLDSINHFITKTYFLEVYDEEDKDCLEELYPMLMFFDLDSFKLGKQGIMKLLSLKLLPVFISSIYSRQFISTWLSLNNEKIGYLKKNSNYKDFLEEISRVVDNSNK